MSALVWVHVCIIYNNVSLRLELCSIQLVKFQESTEAEVSLPCSIGPSEIANACRYLKILAPGLLPNLGLPSTLWSTLPPPWPLVPSFPRPRPRPSPCTPALLLLPHPLLLSSPPAGLPVPGASPAQPVRLPLPIYCLAPRSPPCPARPGPTLSPWRLPPPFLGGAPSAPFYFYSTSLFSPLLLLPVLTLTW